MFSDTSTMISVGYIPYSRLVKKCPGSTIPKTAMKGRFAHRELANDAQENVRGVGAGDNEAEQNKPRQAIHSARLDEDLQQALVSHSTVADEGATTMATLRLSY
jgi:hypothetical protein